MFPLMEGLTMSKLGADDIINRVVVDSLSGKRGIQGIVCCRMRAIVVTVVLRVDE